ncbi:FG-GAP repeat domain-containing protein [Streptomyces sp. NPDC086023]|uniref:FG-GAP repeat domain-containing protein n=1 Tax=Streptomyces sp. NPDC086023 TaxID=3365746 RepID=UPI0037D98C1A
MLTGTWGDVSASAVVPSPQPSHDAWGDPTLYYYAGTGRKDTPFKARVFVSTGWNSYSKLIAADNHAGRKADLWAVTPDGVLYVHPGKGGGRFGTPLRFGGPTSVTPPWTDSDLFVNSGVTPVYGKHGIVAVEASGTVREYTNLTNGHFAATRRTLDAKVQAGQRLISAAALTDDNRAEHYTWNGSALTHLTTGKTVKGSFSGTDLVLGPGDLNGDGKGDLLSRDAHGTLWLRGGTGSTTTFDGPVEVSAGWGAYQQILGAGDISGDGRADVVATGADGRLYIFRGTGRADAPFAPRELIGGGWNAYDTLAAPGDLNGDGRADLVARDAGGTLWFYRASGYDTTRTLDARTVLGKGWGAFKQLS